MTDQFHYSAFGLNISSDLPLPELLAGDGAPNVTIRRAHVPLDLPDAKVRGQTFQATDNKLVLHLADLGDYLAQDGCEILYEPAKNCDENGLRAPIIGIMIGALLLQRGVLPLHASAIQTRRGAVLFAAQSGEGKSTLAAGFRGRGYNFLADDLCAVSSGLDGRPQVMPSFPLNRLWQDTLDVFNESREGLVQYLASIPKYNLPVHGQFGTEPLPLQALYLLGPLGAESVALQPLYGFEKLQELLTHAYILRYTEIEIMKRIFFQRGVEVSRHARIARLFRPAGLQYLEEELDCLEADFNN